MSGEVLTNAYPELSDERLSMRHFFHLAKLSLNVAMREISLVIGRTRLNPKNVVTKFFALQVVQHAIVEHAEVKINVIRDDPRNEG